MWGVLWGRLAPPLQRIIYLALFIPSSEGHKYSFGIGFMWYLHLELVSCGTSNVWSSLNGPGANLKKSWFRGSPLATNFCNYFLLTHSFCYPKMPVVRKNHRFNTPFLGKNPVAKAIFSIFFSLFLQKSALYGKM